MNIMLLLLFTLLSPQNSHCQCNDDEQYVYYEQTQHTLGVINKIIIHPSGCLQDHNNQNCNYVISGGQNVGDDVDAKCKKDTESCVKPRFCC